MRAARRPLSRLAAPAALGAILALSLVLMLTAEAGGPLWLDEGWTLGIVNRPGWGAFVEQLRADPNPPLYFLLMRGWTSVSGFSAAALRAPSTVFAAAAPLVVLFGRPPLPRGDRWAWAAVLALLPAAIHFAQEARGYALLLLLETASAVAFLRLLAAPSHGRAALWCGLTALACLTHYHALLIGGLQGLAYLTLHRARAARTWPAALLFLPWLAWAAPHALRVLQFARPEFAWYPALSMRDAPGLALALTGGLGLVWAALLLVGRLLERPLAARGWTGERVRTPEVALALTAVAAAAIVVGLGLLRPSFTLRYLVPDMPGAALGLVVALRAAGPRGATLTQALLVGFAALTAVTQALHSDAAGRRAFEIETASADLAAAGVSRLVFLWDNPTNAALTPPERTALAGAFFVRAGRPVAVEGVAAAPGEDPNPRLAAALKAQGSAVLWLWDRKVPHTAAVLHPPRLETLDPAIRCRAYAGGSIGVLACVRSGPTSPI